MICGLLSPGHKSAMEEKSPDTEARHAEPLRSILCLLGIIAAVLFVYKMREAIATVTISVVFYYILAPIASWFEGRRIGRRFTVSRLLAVVIAFLAGILALALFLLILIPPIVDQVERFTRNLPEYTTRAEDTFQMLQDRYQRLKLPPEVQSSLRKSMDKIGSESTVLLGRAAQKTAQFFSQIILLLMIPFITFFLMLEKEAVKKTIVSIFPRRHREEAAAVLAESSNALRGYIIGQLVLGLIMGILMSIGLGLMGVKAPVLLGLVAGVTKLIPVIGILLGCIPAAFVALSSSFTLALWVIAIFTVIQLLETKVILPLLMSRYVDLSPLTILISLIVGEQLGGVLGMFIATPVAAVLRIIYLHLRARYD